MKIKKFCSVFGCRFAGSSSFWCLCVLHGLFAHLPLFPLSRCSAALPRAVARGASRWCAAVRRGFCLPRCLAAVPVISLPWCSGAMSRAVVCYAERGAGVAVVERARAHPCVCVRETGHECVCPPLRCAHTHPGSRAVLQWCGLAGDEAWLRVRWRACL